MKLIYAEPIDKKIKKEINEAKDSGKRVDKILLTVEELEELRSIDSGVKIGGKYRGCEIGVEV